MEKKQLVVAVQYQEERFTKKILFQKGESVVFILNFMPGQTLPTHKHPGTDVYILGLEGNGTMTVDGEDTPLMKGETIHIGGEEAFAYSNSGDAPASLHVVLCKIPSPIYAQEV
ncbi:cupin domain-containing protein [Paenibacillus wynnii]|uniref:Cupin n=1 Tax=Paenibacillus wynnii TaxID=268407 RepID=A0A098MG76_9BACL|nr:cupin domain-containing protein [Paenibacillus wynnii]KGE20542.1 cupin [Paenibacillus wynnii]